MQPYSITRAIISFWFTLLVISTLVTSSPLPEPEPNPTPIDPALASVISSNLNLGCQNGCPAASSAQQLNANGALRVGAAVSPLSLFGGVVLAGGVLAAL